MLLKGTSRSGPHHNWGVYVQFCIIYVPLKPTGCFILY